MRPLIFLLFIISLVGCGYSERKIYAEREPLARDSKAESFVEMNDGTVLKFTELKVVRKPMVYEYLQGDGKKLNIKSNDIKAFQTNKFYACKVYDKARGVIGKLPFNELFAERLKDGKIELFMIVEMRKTGNENTSGYTRTFLIRKGKDGDIVPLSKNRLKGYISDNKNLADNFDALYKNTYLLKNVLAILDQYNQ